MFVMLDNSDRLDRYFNFIKMKEYLKVARTIWTVGQTDSHYLNMRKRENCQIVVEGGTNTLDYWTVGKNGQVGQVGHL